MQTPSSYQAIYHALLQEPHALALLSDRDLLKLLHTLPPQPRLKAAIFGEAIFRFWLFQDACDEEITKKLTAHLPDHCLSRITALARHKTSAPLPENMEYGTPTHEFATSRHFFYERANAMLRCDGMIPVVIGQSSQALPIPFMLQPGENQETHFRDAAGFPLPKWNALVQDILTEHQCGIRLLIRTGPRAADLCGGSCALPVLLALARRDGRIGSYHPLHVLATGVVFNGHIQPTGGIEAKRILAERMGCKMFAAPGQDTGDHTVNLSIGLHVHQALEHINTRLLQLGISMIPSDAVGPCLQELIRGVHHSSITLSHAEKRLEHIEHAISAMKKGPIATEQHIKAELLRGTMCNYNGDPQSGKKHIEKALQAAESEALWLPYVNAVANQVVSLTDLGFLDQAKEMGLALINKVNHIGWSGAHDRLLAAKTAYGATGGQPLYQLALKNRDKDTERLSLECLENALDLARELENKEGIARGTAQCFLWQATFSPESMPEEYVAASQTLDTLGNDAPVSRTYLDRARFFGAYRHYLITQQLITGFDTWPLPEIHTTQTTWLYATALKYRGTLHAANNHIEQAITDFNTACELLDHEAPPLIRFIGATAALQAARSLSHTDPIPAATFLKHAANIFQSLETIFPAEFGTANWLSNALNHETPNPQSAFAY